MNNNEPKVLLTINLEAKLSSQREEVTINVTEEKKFTSINEATGKEEIKRLVKRYELPHQQRTTSPACKKTTISETAVNHMLSTEVPDWYRAKRNGGKIWDTLSNDEKLQQHFTRMAYPNSFTYVFID